MIKGVAESVCVGQKVVGKSVNRCTATKSGGYGVTTIVVRLKIKKLFPSS